MAHRKCTGLDFIGKPGMKNDGLKRELTKTLAEIKPELNENTLSNLLEICLEWFHSPTEKIALKAYALDVLYHISNIYPDFKLELITTIDQQLPYSSPGMRSRSIKMLQQLFRETGHIKT